MWLYPQSLRWLRPSKNYTALLFWGRIKEARNHNGFITLLFTDPGNEEPQPEASVDSNRRDTGDTLARTFKQPQLRLTTDSRTEKTKGEKTQTALLPPQRQEEVETCLRYRSPNITCPTTPLIKEGLRKNAHTSVREKMHVARTGGIHENTRKQSVPSEYYRIKLYITVQGHQPQP